MNQLAYPSLKLTETWWKGIILALSAAVILFTIWCLANGITTIFMHLYYFPIIILAYRYRWKGCGLATLLGLAYLGLVIAFEPGQPDVILGALYRFFVFVGIAAVVAYLSERLIEAQDSRQQSTELRERYLSLAPAIILALDRNGVITYLNEKGGKILECLPEEVVGKSWFDVFLPEKDRERVNRVFSQMIAGQVEPNRVFENAVLTQSGTGKIIRWHNTVIHDESGVITGTLGYGEDITEEKWAQDALQEMQQFQESVIANANVWISVLEPDGTLLVWNNAAETISGYKKSDVLGKNTVWKKLYPDNAYRRKVTGDIQRVLGRDEFLENFETEILCADQTKKTIVWNTRELHDNHGVVTSYIAIGYDVTAQRSAESRAGESSRFLATMIDALPMPIFFKDVTGKYLGCNPPFAEYLGISCDNLIGKTAYDISPKDLADKYTAADRQIFDNPVSQSYETQVLYADGSRHDVIFYKAPFFNKDGTLGGLIGAFLDITDRKHMETALKESESFNRGLVENLPDYVAVYGLDGNLLYVNPASAIGLGYDAETLVGTHVLSYVAKEYHEMVIAKMTARRKGGDTSPYEIEMVTKTGLRRSVIVKATDIQYQNNPAILLLLIDITDRKQAELSLRESEVKYRAFFTTSRDCVFITTLDGRWLDFNDAAVELLGYESREDLLNTKISLIYANSDDRDAHIRYIREKGFSVEYPVDLKKKDGTIINTLITTVARKDAAGNTIGFQGSIRDITETKAIQDRIKELLHLQEEQLRTINASPAVAFLWKAEENWPVEMVSSNVSQFGYSVDDFVSGRVLFSSIIHPEDLERVAAEVENNSKNPIDEFSQTYRIFGKDGVEHWINDYTHIRRDNEGIITHYEGVILDVTDRKHAEEALRTSEERFRGITERISDLIIIVDPEGYPTFVSPSIASILGRPPEVFIGKMAGPDIILAEDVVKVAQAMERLKNGSLKEPVEFRMLKSDGSHAVFEGSGIPVFIRGVYAGVQIVARDITERKRAEEEIKRSIERFRMVMDSIDALVYVADMQTHELLFINKYGKDIWGEAIEGKLCWQIIQSDQSGPCPFCTNDRLVDPNGNPTGILNWEFQNTANGRWYDCRDSAIRWLDGRLVRLEIATDITGRKQIEEALHESRQLFADIISFLPDPTFVIDNDGKVLAWNRALEKLSGVPAGDIIGKGDHEYSLWQYGKRRSILIDLVLHPDQDAARMNYVNIHPEGNTVTAQTELTLPGSGRRIPLSLVTSPLIDAQGKITGAIESMRDISRIRQAEAELARMNQDLEKIVKDRTRLLEDEVAQRIRAEQDVQKALSYTRSVIESNPDLVTVLDENGIIMDINATGELLTGLPRVQLISTPYFGYLVDDGTLQEKFSGLIRKGTIENFVQLRRTDGHVTPMSVHASVIKGMDGGKDRIIVAAHDITRQKQDEESIRASLEEKVLLLREIHHRVKNNLQIIISLTNLQMRQTEDPMVKQIMAETQNRVRAMSLVHEKLYRSENIARIDFADYTRFLATQLFSYYGTDTQRVHLDMAMEKIMVDINAAVPLGLLMNELVSNALKHAFPDEKEGTIRIWGSDNGDLITLAVEDNGIGMPADIDWKNTTSLGMRLVISLVDQVDGTITLDRSKGTTFTVTLKRKPES
ncbi:MAG: PAS domain S-box protein [Methanoregula sp.]